MSTVHARFRFARNQAGLSIGQAQRLTGVVRLDGIEAGRMPTDDETRRLADACNVSIAWLRDGVSSPIAEATARMLFDADIYSSDRSAVLELLSTLPVKAGGS